MIWWDYFGVLAVRNVAWCGSNEDLFIWDRMSQLPNALIMTDDGSFTMRQMEHGEEFHSRMGAMTEARELYIKKSGFGDRVRDGEAMTVLDVGLGLGYNAVLTIASWLKAEASGPLSLVSLEIDSALVKELCGGVAPWMVGWDPDLCQIASKLAPISGAEPERFQARIVHSNGQVCEWKVYVGDATTMDLSPIADGGFNFVWQDAFSPKKNPPMWTENWFRNIRRSCTNDCTLVTYSVARQVRDALAAAGFEANKIAALGTKKHWLMARPV